MNSKVFNRVNGIISFLPTPMRMKIYEKLSGGGA